MDHVPSERQYDADERRDDDAGYAVGGRLKRALLIGVGVASTLGFTSLGVWQIERRAWKLDLIARVEARIAAPPVAPPLPGSWAQVNERDHGYRRVRVSGDFDHSKTTLVQALTERGAGYWVLTPLRTEQGIILINRGFVATRHRVEPDRPVTRTAVTGLIRLSEPGGGLLRDNDVSADRWYSRDVTAIAQARGLGRVAPFFIDAEAGPEKDGAPVGGLTVIKFRNTHLAYALTWFALALLAAVGTTMMLRYDRRRRWTRPSSP